MYQRRWSSLPDTSNNMTSSLPVDGTDARAHSTRLVLKAPPSPHPPEPVPPVFGGGWFPPRSVKRLLPRQNLAGRAEHGDGLCNSLEPRRGEFDGASSSVSMLREENLCVFRKFKSPQQLVALETLGRQAAQHIAFMPMLWYRTMCRYTAVQTCTISLNEMRGVELSAQAATAL